MKKLSRFLIIILIVIQTLTLYKIGTSDYWNVLFIFFTLIDIYFYALTCESSDKTDTYNGPSGDFFCDM